MTRWYNEKKKEHFYNLAKRVGYRARSAYKLHQIQRRFDIIFQGDVVIDLGASPGGWSQVAQELVGPEGHVISVDILPMKPLDNVDIIQADITDAKTFDLIKQRMKHKDVDVVISDMSPDISGNYSVDQARSMWLCEQALMIATTLLKSEGNFVCKIFEGEDTKKFIENVSHHFSAVKKFSPEASRKRSSEIYIIAKSCKKI